MGFPFPSLSFVHREFHLFTWPSPQENEKSRSQSAAQRCLMPALQMAQNALVSVQLTSKGSHKINPGRSEMRHLRCPTGAAPHSHGCSHRGTAVCTEMFICKSHLLTWSLLWTWVSHPPLKAGNAALRRQVGRFGASGTRFSHRGRRSRGPSQCLEGCALMLVCPVTATLKK